MDQCGNHMTSSLPLQIIIFFHWWFCLFWLLMNIFLFSWKVYTYYYSASALGWEITIMVLMLTLEATRFQLASRGNKTEKFLPLAWSAGLAIPSLVGYCFFVELQTYILRLDIILNSISICFVSLELLLSVNTMITFYRMSSR
mmetsp:Transcript_2970/g.3499  ORF Transcript_2970/g.3499 Transcript_2970/m.3499 type:complete len:143 (+) Transcript_2970:275-703(+)